MHLLFDFHTSGTMPVLPSTTTTTAHDSRNANDACSRISARNWSDSSSSKTPSVDHIKNARPHLRALINAVARDTDLVDGDGAAAARVAQAIH